MLKHFPLVPLVMVCAITATFAADYHVDSAGGDDAASGLSPAEAWRSLAKANACVLKPGDQLLFKAGGQWSGQLKPRGSGGSRDGKVKLVVIGKYGEGAAPRIDGEGKHRDAVLLENVGFMELRDLEITNLGPSRAAGRTGVHVSAKNIGTLERIYLRNLHVHDVNGDLRKEHEGCGIFFEASGGKDTRFDGLLIEKCRVEKTDRNGICQRGNGKVRSRNVIIRDNVLEDIGGDGIKLWGTDGGLIERNIVRGARARCTDHAAGIWPFACDDTVIQFNQVSGTKGTKDGQAYDADYYCRRTIFQYNRSFRNEGGFMLLCAPGNAWSADTVVRYNISVEDGVKSSRVFHFGGGSSGSRIYNNTIVIGPGQNVPMLLFTQWDGGKARDTRFTNNLFIVREGGRATYDFGPSSGNAFENNLFFGNHVGLPAGVTTTQLMPPFAGPLATTGELQQIDGLRPAQGAGFPRGKRIPDSGGRDFFGTPLPAAGPPSIGAAEPRP